MPASPSGDDALLGSLLERWFALRAAGETPEPAELCAAAPELLPRFRRLVARDAELLPERDEAAPANRVIAHKIGDYRLLARIGSGASSEVFLARQESLARHVALKIMRPDFVADGTRRLRFQREAEITAALEHPNIAPVYEIGEDGAHVFLAMRLIPGQALADLAGTLPPRVAAGLVAQIARGLHAAHAIGIVHRDVKPANVMIDGDRAFIVDFGLARAHADLSLTHSGQAPGTLPYMAPEQLRGGPAALDARVDVYGLGATLYHCLAAAPPFPGETSLTLVRSIMMREPRRLADVPRDLDVITRRALEKEPEQRFANALAFAEDLERFVRGEPIHSRPVGPWARLRKLARRHPATATVLGVAAAIVLVLAIVVHNQGAARSRDRALGVAAVEERLALVRPDDAFVALQELRARHGIDAEIDDLAHRVRSQQLRETLLDELNVAPRDQDIAYLEALAAQLDGAHPDVLADPATGAGRALLAAYRRDANGAGAALAANGVESAYPRFVAALRAHLAGIDVGEALTASPQSATGADDHVLTAIVFRVREAASDEAAREVAAALEHDRYHARARYGNAVAHVNRGRPDRAEDLLDNREDAQRPEVLVLLATCALRRGRPEVARARLDEALRQLASLGRPDMPRRQRAALFLALVDGDLTRFDRDWASAVGQWGDVAQLWMLAAQAAVLRDDDEAARAAFRRAHELARHPSVRREAAIALLQQDVIDLLSGARAAAPDFVRDLMARARELRTTARAAHDGRIESDAWIVQGQLLEAGGDLAGAAAATSAALAVDPDNPTAVHQFVTQAYQDFAAARSTSSASADDLLALGRTGQRAVDCCERVRQRASFDATYMASRQQIETMLAGVGLAVGSADVGDEAAARRFLARARELCEATADDTVLPMLQQFEALVEPPFRRVR